jgi:hypothetical protein
MIGPVNAQPIMQAAVSQPTGAAASLRHLTSALSASLRRASNSLLQGIPPLAAPVHGTLNGGAACASRSSGSAFTLARGISNDEEPPWPSSNSNPNATDATDAADPFRTPTTTAPRTRRSTKDVATAAYSGKSAKADQSYSEIE